MGDAQSSVGFPRRVGPYEIILPISVGESKHTFLAREKGKEELLEGPAINEETIDRLLGAINLLARQKREWQGRAGSGSGGSDPDVPPGGPVGKREPLT